MSNILSFSRTLAFVEIGIFGFMGRFNLFLADKIVSWLSTWSAFSPDPDAVTREK